MAQRKKTGGRKQGTPNKTTTIQREFIQDLLNEQGDKMKRELNKLQGKDYITAVLQLTEFVMPKMQRQQVEVKAEPTPMPMMPQIVTIVETVSPYDKMIQG